MTLNMPEYYRDRLVPAEELQARVATFQHALSVAEMNGALITHNTGLYYLAGTIQPVQLYVPTEGEPILLVRRNRERVALESPFALQDLTSFRDLPLYLAPNGTVPTSLGLELDVMPVLTYRRYEKALPEVKWKDVGGILRAQRSIKTSWELEQIRAVRPLADAMLDGVREFLRVGLTEVEFAGMLEARARSLGHQGRSWLRAYNQDMYWGHLIAGESGVVASYFDSPNGGWGLNPAKPDGAGFGIITENSPVLVDYVATRYGYVLDQTRTAVVGTLPDELQRAYDATVAVQNAVIAAAKPGAVGSDLFKLALKVAKEQGIGDSFGGLGDNKAKFVGHGVGTEIDELPLLAGGWHEPLQPGMVFALEPKYTHPTLGIVGIENTWLVTENGVERLTPEDDEVIEV
jgi:Xaa-Pro dipeptidase